MQLYLFLHSLPCSRIRPQNVYIRLVSNGCSVLNLTYAFISVDSRTSGSIAWAFAQLSTLIKLRTYQSTLLGTTDVRGDLKIFLEGLRCVQSLYGGLILLALLSSLDRYPPRRHLRRRKRRNAVRPMRIGQIGSSTSFPRMVKAFSFSSSFSTSSLSSSNCWWCIA